MSEMEQKPEGTRPPTEQSKIQQDATPGLFAPAPEERSSGMPLAVWLTAGAAVLVVVVALLLFGRHKAPAITGVQPLDAYATSLPLSRLQMSESTSLSGGKSTFIDGHITNNGSSTVTEVMVQVLFRNEEQMPPGLETLPMMLVRTHEPYVDTQTVNSNPLKPGDDREFRLIFESIPANWNMQMPEVHIIAVQKK